MSLNEQVQAAMDDERAPEGKIIIKRMGFLKLYNIEDLEFLNELGTGQIFHAVARHYNKESRDYGAKWPRYRTPQGEVSKQFTFIDNAVSGLRNDLARFNLVCEHLGEQPLTLAE